MGSVRILISVCLLLAGAQRLLATDVAPNSHSDQAVETVAERTPQERESADLFRHQIGPWLQSQCLRCHGAQKQESDLRLDEPNTLTTGGQRGAAVTSGDAQQSLLYRAVAGLEADLQMPPDGDQASAEQLSALAKWIELGAIWPEDVKRLEVVEPGLSPEARDYWAFRARTPTPPPTLDLRDDLTWARNEIDHFIAHQARLQGFAPIREADRRTLIRRLYFDLTGHPPRWEEVSAFEADSSPLAYERMVDQLLDRPEYGQRWARHWLDLVRYAESDGFKADVYRPHAWHYRDYVVRSLNADKPYDRFVQEQLAGDELFPEDMDARVATGYLRLWPLEDNQKDVERQWTLILQDITEVTSEAIMGLGLRCARCHDHKYDPISQRDYYRFQAFFAAMLPRDDLAIPRRGSMESLCNWEQQTQSVRREMRQMENQLIASRKKTIEAYPPYLQAMYARPVDQWGPLDHQYAYLARPQVEKLPTEKLEFPGEMRPRWQSLQAALTQQSTPLENATTPVMSVTDVGDQAPSTHVNQDPQREAVEPGFPMVLRTIEELPAIVPTSRHSTGRRAALAQWLTRPDHPLTARVIVNRIWQQYFGRGIVATPNDFGHQGTSPTHPELLDYLATQLVHDGWSLKQLHRRIVLSATYRQAAPTSLTEATTAQTLYLGRLARRLDGEQIRDAMLRVSGELVPYSASPSVDHGEPVPSIQLKNVRNRPEEWIFAFDGPDMFNSCARRYTTTTPIQSLLVVNSPWSHARAASLARRIQHDHAAMSIDEQIQAAFRAVLARNPQETERQHARRLWPLDSPDATAGIESQATLMPGDAAGQTTSGVAGETATAPSHDESTLNRPSLDALTDLCHVLMCSNEFIYVD